MTCPCSGVMNWQHFRGEGKKEEDPAKGCRWEWVIREQAADGEGEVGIGSTSQSDRR